MTGRCPGACTWSVRPRCAAAPRDLIVPIGHGAEPAVGVGVSTRWWPAFVLGTLVSVPVAHAPAEVRGNRLVVRRYASGDAARLHEAIVQSVDHLRPWMPWASLEPLKLSDRRQLIARWIERWQAGEDFNFGVFEGRALVGGCGLHRRAGPSGLEIGYWTRAGQTQRGLATEAAACMVEAAFSMPGVHFVEVHHDVSNVASRRVPERLGFTFVEEREDEAAAPAEVGVEQVWRLHRTDWKGLAPQR